LPNLVAGRQVVPELVQKACTPETVAAQLAEFLDRPEVAEAVRGGLAEVRRELGERGVFERAADAVLSELDALDPPPSGRTD
jgi:lipid-A-disaccharide synthase